ncbi:hypothetical protein AURDEDRAFT_163555 [Auricularia subglabra TFB-10046 SS5]|nr:hypothetical protein AURDEDRAFT_163555 [Auricularia subglabra TFB-10046 SS5]
MTSTLIFGFFPLVSGVKTTSPRKNTKGTTTHIEYKSFIPSGASQIPCTLRVWVAPAAPVHPQNTVAFLVGKLHASPNETTLIDVHSLHAVPGNPASDTYEDSIPDFDAPWVVLLGHASSGATTLADRVSRGFTLTASEYIRGSPLAAPYYARFSGNTTRWANTPAPNINTACQVYRPVLAPVDGMLSLDITNITLNIGPLAVAQSGTAQQSASASASPTKKRRFQVALAEGNAAGSAAPGTTVPVASTSADPSPALAPAGTSSVVSVPDEDDVSLTDDAGPSTSTKARGKRRAPAS